MHRKLEQVVPGRDHLPFHRGVHVTQDHFGAGDYNLAGILKSALQRGAEFHSFLVLKEYHTVVEVMAMGAAVPIHELISSQLARGQ